MNTSVGSRALCTSPKGETTYFHSNILDKSDFIIPKKILWKNVDFPKNWHFANAVPAIAQRAVLIETGSVKIKHNADKFSNMGLALARAPRHTATYPRIVQEHPKQGPNFEKLLDCISRCIIFQCIPPLSFKSPLRMHENFQISYFQAMS